MAKKRIIDESTKTNITGDKIKEARKKAGFSQKQLSTKLEIEAVYVCRGSVSRIESGERLVSDIELDAISRVLNVSLDYLFGRNESK
jgi:Predicted transcription factor, homolog of eukaryotic MBF1